MFFLQWKNLVMQEVHCEKDLKELITSKFNDITKKNSDDFYSKMLSYILKYERREIILEIHLFFILFLSPILISAYFIFMVNVSF